MLSSCCSWFCLDSATVDEHEANSGSAPQPPQQGAYVNSGYSPSPPQPEHSCKACGGRFDTPARKHVCVDCKKNYCGHCSAQLEPRPRLCHTCQRFYGNLIERAELMKLKVKDLRDYLHLHEVPTQMCREKEELVDLVLGQQTPSSDGYEPPSSDPPSSQNLPDDDPPAAPTVTQQSTDTINITSISTNVSTEPQDTTTASSNPPSTSTSTESVPPPNTQDDSQVSDPEELVVTGRRASMSDISCLEDIESLSVRQLKEILARNFVDYKGCCEKWELMERVTRLYHDHKNRQNIANSTADDTDLPGTVGGLQEDSLCRICMDSPIDCVLLECGHMVTCSRCGKRMNECPICRQYVVRAVHVFRS